MNSFSLKDTPKQISKSKSVIYPPIFSTDIPHKKKIIKKLSLNFPLKKVEKKINYPLTNRPEIKLKLLSPIKVYNNNKKIENYLLSTSLFCKNKNNSESSFDIDYFKKIAKKNSPLIGERSVESSILTKNIRETFKKNLIIDLIKKKREEISDNEKNIQYSFKLRKKQIDNNFSNFLMLKEEYDTIISKKDKIMDYYKMAYYKVRSIYYNEQINNKRLKDTIEKTIRDIYKLKDYSDFINKIYNIPYAFDQINDNLFYGNKFEILTEKIIKSFNEKEFENEEKKKNKILKDIQLFIENYNSYEDKIIQLLQEKESILKDINSLKDENDFKIQNLIIKKNNYENDENSIINIKQKLNERNNIQENENGDEIFNNALKYIIEIADLLEISTSCNNKTNTIIDYVNYCKNILNILKNKEYLIDKYTKGIEYLINSKNKKDKYIIEQIISNRKKYNLEIKQYFLKEEKNKIDEINRIKTLNKNKKKVLKGRIILDYKKFNLPKKKIKKKIIKNNNNNDINLLYYFSEDEEI